MKCTRAEYVFAGDAAGAMSETHAPLVTVIEELSNVRADVSYDAGNVKCTPSDAWFVYKVPKSTATGSAGNTDS